MMIGKFSKKKQKKKQQHNEALFLIQTVSKHWQLTDMCLSTYQQGKNSISAFNPLEASAPFLCL